MKVVNLFGEPNAGKSTMAAAIFAGLRFRGIRAELVTEYAKDLVWAGKLAEAAQSEILGEQYQRLQRLKDAGVPVAVTDSPLMLSAVYNGLHFSQARELFERFENRNYLVKRPADRPYSPIGRVQSEEEAAALRPSVVRVLHASYSRYGQVVSSPSTAEMIVEEVAHWVGSV